MRQKNVTDLLYTWDVGFTDSPGIIGSFLCGEAIVKDMISNPERTFQDRFRQDKS